MARSGNGGAPRGGAAPLVERFEEFHRARPDVYRAFKSHARRLRRMGHGRLSAQYICDYLSFETAVDGRPASEWKLNHDFGPFYARMLVAEDAGFAGAFERRRSVADGADLAALLRAA
jgi:hypothetical protein